MSSQYTENGILFMDQIMDLSPLLTQIASQYQLMPDGAHGLSHWGRVLENGLKLLKMEGGDETVITLFAIFHDSCRHNQSLDPGHGNRGADLAESLLRGNPLLTETQLDLLKTACRQHTDGKTEGNLTVRICWDSDRLDLARVGIRPRARYLCTDSAKSKLVIDWANLRAKNNFTPDFVKSNWNKFF